MVQVHIPVEKHVRKYLMKRYGVIHKASKTTLIGKLVLEGLQRKYVKPDKTIDTHFQYVVEVPGIYHNTIGHTLTRNAAQKIGDCLGVLFDEDMCNHLDFRVKQGAKALPELKLFLESYNISEDDVKVETLYKVYQRHCKNGIKIKKFQLNN